MTNVVKVPQLAWHGVKDLELAFPDGWNVSMNNMQGFDRPALPDGQIRAAVRFPIGSSSYSNAGQRQKAGGYHF